MCHLYQVLLKVSIIFYTEKKTWNIESLIYLKEFLKPIFLTYIFVLFVYVCFRMGT